MQTFYVIFNDPDWGFSIDIWSDRGQGPRSARAYFNVGVRSRERLRKIFRARRDRVVVFDIWSKGRIREYRDWCKARSAKVGASPLLDYLETSEPPLWLKGL